MKKALAFLMAAVMLMSMLTACGNKDNAADNNDNDVNTEATDKAAADKAAADKVAALIDAIYVQERTEETDAVRGRQGCLGRPDRCPEGTGGR